MKYLVAALIFLTPLNLYAQTILKGKVVDEKDRAVPGASVFLSNTSIGTRAGDDGYFELRVPQGKFDLIVSSIGFQTYKQTIISTSIQNQLIIRLKIKASEMENLVIEPFEKNGWEKWGKFFTENFIGTSSFAYDCKLKNKDAIRFRHSKKDNRLSATALEPLVIENKALGYTVTLQLEHFSYDFNNRYLIYVGYAYFEEMEGNASKKKKWNRNRQDAYQGSIMHFMRSVYRNTLSQEGFQVRRLQKIDNEEKNRIKVLYQENVKRTPGGMLVNFRANKDSADHYDKVMAQADVFDIIGRDILTGDSIAFAFNPTTAGLEFENHLHILYTKALAPIEYRKMFPKAGASMISHITLVNGEPLQIESNGSYFDPSELLSSGYWAWSEKISMMLPFDYKPG